MMGESSEMGAGRFFVIGGCAAPLIPNRRRLPIGRFAVTKIRARHLGFAIWGHLFHDVHVVDEWLLTGGTRAERDGLLDPPRREVERLAPWWGRKNACNASDEADVAFVDSSQKTRTPKAS